jgi:predicted nuclease with TOPRIM domain
MITDLGGDLSEAYGAVVEALDKNEAKNDELDEVPARVRALEEELAEVRRSNKVLLDMYNQLGEGVLV